MRLQPILAGFEAARAASDRQRQDSMTAAVRNSTVGLSLWLHQRLLTEREHAERVVKAADLALRQLQELQ